jgi:hypothetical protein
MEVEISEIKMILRIHHFILVGLIIAVIVLWTKIRLLRKKITKLEDNKA